MATCFYLLKLKKYLEVPLEGHAKYYYLVKGKRNRKVRIIQRGGDIDVGIYFCVYSVICAISFGFKVVQEMLII